MAFSARRDRERDASVSDKGSLRAEPVDGYTNGMYTGNSYVAVRRSDGGSVGLNPGGGFWGGRHCADENIALLYSTIPGRF